VQYLSRYLYEGSGTHSEDSPPSASPRCASVGGFKELIPIIRKNNMEFIIAWYPAAKLALIATIIVIAILLYKYKLHKLNIIFGLAIAVLIYLTPIKIDGTESHSAHNAEVQIVHQKYKIIEAEVPNITTKHLTFKQKMQAEEKRSKAANQQLNKEITND